MRSCRSLETSFRGLEGGSSYLQAEGSKFKTAAKVRHRDL